MPDSILFLPECHVDTALMRALLYDRQKLITHIKGAPKVGDALHQQAKRYGTSRLVVAMVDNDKHLFSIPKLQPFDQVVLRCEEPGCLFTVYQHRELVSQYLVVLNPACDGWLYGNMRAAGLTPQAYQLPELLTDFLRFTKTVYAEEQREIVSLLKALRASAPPAYAQLAVFVGERLREAGEAAW